MPRAWNTVGGKNGPRQGPAATSEAGIVCVWGEVFEFGKEEMASLYGEGAVTGRWQASQMAMRCPSGYLQRNSQLWPLGMSRESR